MLLGGADRLMASQNLVKNPGFATNFNSWVTNVSPGVTFSWTAQDANGAGNSGSARVNNQQPNAGANSSPIWQCIPVLGKQFTVSMKSRVPAGQSRTGEARLFVYWYLHAGCAGSAVQFTFANSTTGSAWVTTTQHPVAPDGAQSALVYIGVTKNEAGGELSAFFDDVVVSLDVPATCVPGDTTLCLDDNPGDRRFQVQMSYDTVQSGGLFGLGHAIALSSLGVNRGGLFWFFDPTNPEMLIKVLAGCPVNERFWVFSSAGTNVGFRVAVADTDTGEVFYIDNPDLHPAPPLQEVEALPCD